MKRKRNRERRLAPSRLIRRLGRSRLIRVLVSLELIALAGAVYYCLVILSFPFGTPGYLVTPTPIEETIEVPLNSQDPVYTKNKYSGWVSISIIGRVQLNGGDSHDAFFYFDDVTQGPRREFSGFLIDGVYALQGRGRPKYRNDHIYGIAHAVNGSLRSMGADSPRTIGFQVVSEATEDLEGLFTVEVSSDSYKHRPEGAWALMAFPSFEQLVPHLEMPFVSNPSLRCHEPSFLAETYLKQSLRRTDT